MAWSPVQRSNAGIIWVEQPGDYANQIPTTPATAPYGFTDAFSARDNWYAKSFLAIDQGPIVVMIENYRSGMLWNLFMRDPDVQAGLRRLRFHSPHLN